MMMTAVAVLTDTKRRSLGSSGLPCGAMDDTTDLHLRSMQHNDTANVCEGMYVRIMCPH